MVNVRMVHTSASILFGPSVHIGIYWEISEAGQIAVLYCDVGLFWNLQYFSYQYDTKFPLCMHMNSHHYVQAISIVHNLKQVNLISSRNMEVTEKILE